MQEIKERTCYEARDFQSLIGFSLVGVNDVTAQCDDKTQDVVSFTFENGNGVAISMTLIDGELSVSQPYIPNK